MGRVTREIGEGEEREWGGRGKREWGGRERELVG